MAIIEATFTTSTATVQEITVSTVTLVPIEHPTHYRTSFLSGAIVGIALVISLQRIIRRMEERA